MIELVDIGVNLTNRSLTRNLEAIMQRSREAGVEQMVVTGTSIEESQEAIKLCASYPQRLVSTCGVHPHHASEWTGSSFEQLQEMAAQACVRAIGETGLDFNRNYSSAEDQELAFRQQIKLAIKLQLPLFCHQRDAHERFVDIVRENRDQVTNIVVHCFTDSRQALIDYLDLDCHIGITGWICDERRGLDLQQMVSLIPADRLLVETDAPYLLPRDLDPKPTGSINEPAYLPHILARVALHQGKSSEQLARETLLNSRQFFKLGR